MRTRRMTQLELISRVEHKTLVRFAILYSLVYLDQPERDADRNCLVVFWREQSNVQSGKQWDLGAILLY